MDHIEKEKKIIESKNNIILDLYSEVSKLQVELKKEIDAMYASLLGENNIAKENIIKIEQ